MQPVAPIAESGLGTFLALNLLGVILYPIACVVGLLVFWSNDTLFGIVLSAYAGTHLVVLCFGLIQFGHALRLMLLSLAIFLFLFAYNLHWIGQADNSPFSDGVGTVDQHVYGWFGYYRIFDQPDAVFGKSYIDLSALACNLELLVLIMILLDGLFWLWPSRLGLEKRSGN